MADSKNPRYNAAGLGRAGFGRRTWGEASMRIPLAVAAGGALAWSPSPEMRAALTVGVSGGMRLFRTVLA